jgi:hypothetical protein
VQILELLPVQTDLWYSCEKPIPLFGRTQKRPSAIVETEKFTVA